MGGLGCSWYPKVQVIHPKLIQMIKSLKLSWKSRGNKLSHALSASVYSELEADIYRLKSLHQLIIEVLLHRKVVYKDINLWPR